MELMIAGVSVEELKKAGLSDGDIEFIRERSVDYKVTANRMAPATAPSIIAIAQNAFEVGLALGLAKARGLDKVSKRIGF